MGKDKLPLTMTNHNKMWTTCIIPDVTYLIQFLLLTLIDFNTSMDKQL